MLRRFIDYRRACLHPVLLPTLKMFIASIAGTHGCPPSFPCSSCFIFSPNSEAEKTSWNSQPLTTVSHTKPPGFFVGTGNISVRPFLIKQKSLARKVFGELVLAQRKYYLYVKYERCFSNVFAEIANKKKQRDLIFFSTPR